MTSGQTGEIAEGRREFVKKWKRKNTMLFCPTLDTFRYRASLGI
jgi:hypothetical protein